MASGFYDGREPFPGTVVDSPVDAQRVVRLTLAGSMSFQGQVIGWAAIHRRHHAFADRPGDPHSPTVATPVRWANCAEPLTPMSAGCARAFLATPQHTAYAP